MFYNKVTSLTLYSMSTLSFHSQIYIENCVYSWSEVFLRCAHCHHINMNTCLCVGKGVRMIFVCTHRLYIWRVFSLERLSNCTLQLSVWSGIRWITWRIECFVVGTGRWLPVLQRPSPDAMQKISHWDVSGCPHWAISVCSVTILSIPCTYWPIAAFRYAAPHFSLLHLRLVI